jgi:ABC-type lipoprotein release transport system permease subunit
MSRFGRRWRALRHHRLQSILAAAAISAAVALPVVLISVGGGVASHEIDALQHSGYQIAVSAPGLHGVESAHELALRIAGLPHVGAASPVLSAPVDAFPSSGATSPVLAEGVVPSAFSQTEGPTELGLFPRPLPFSDPTDALRFDNGTYAGPPAREVMVATPFADAFGVAVGDVLPLAPTSDAAGGIPFRVVGIFGTPPSTLGPTAAFAIVLPLSELQLLAGFARETGASGGLIDAADTIQVALVAAQSSDPDAIASVAQSIAAIVPYYGVSQLTDQAEQLRASEAILTGFYLALSSVGLTVGLVFLGVVLVRRVESDRRVIGIRRALGVPAATIAGEWLRTSVLLGGAGALGGIFGGIAIVLYLARFGGGAVATAAQLSVFDPVLLGTLGLAVVGMGSAASLAATRAALRLSIPEALR